MNKRFILWTAFVVLCGHQMMSQPLNYEKFDSETEETEDNSEESLREVTHTVFFVLQFL
jgi:hypothetical protein